MVNIDLDYYLHQLLGEFSEIAPFLTAIIFVYFGIVLICAVVSFVIYFLNAIGLYEMSSSLGLKNPWYGFIPFLNSFAIGRIAEKYQKKNGAKPAKFSVILLTLEIVMAVLSVITLFSAVSTVIGVASFAAGYLADVTSSAGIGAYNIMSILWLVFAAFLLVGVATAYLVVYYIAFWRTCAVFDYKNASLYTVLSVFFSFLAPIFLFVIRKNKPFTDGRAQLDRGIDNFSHSSPETEQKDNFSHPSDNNE